MFKIPLGTWLGIQYLKFNTDCDCYSVTKSYPTPQPMDYSIPDSSVLQHLPEIAQIHVQQIVISDIKKVPLGRAWQPIPVFLTGESPLTEEPGGYGPWDYKEVGHDWVTNTDTHEEIKFRDCFTISNITSDSTMKINIPWQITHWFPCLKHELGMMAEDISLDFFIFYLLWSHLKLIIHNQGYLIY